MGDEAGVGVTHTDGVSGDFLEACGAEVEADIGTGGEDIAWGALLAVHTLFVGVFALATVVGAVPAALLCQVVPLVLATGARIARFAVGFVVALCEVVVANLIDTGFTCAWGDIGQLVGFTAHLAVVFPTATAHVTTINTDGSTVVRGAHGA